MKVAGQKGITLEQNKEPALSRDIRRLEGLVATERRMERPVAATPELLAPYEIVMLAKEARIIDESDGRRLWKKLSQAARESIGGIVVDAIDDEPYISSQIKVLLQYPEQLAEGIALAKRSVGAAKVSIEVYKNLLDTDIRIPASVFGTRIARVGGSYPAEQRTRRASRRLNTLVLGACSLIHLQRAVFEGLCQTSCFVTVAGDCVANPGNYEVPVGCSVSQVLDRVGLILNPKRIVAGGSMTGFGIIDPDTVYISPTTRGILAFAEEFRDMGYSCIGCGRCTHACPEGLSPCHIYKMMLSRRRRNLPLFDADRCTGCGTCSYVCPAKLDLAQVVQRAARLRQDGQGGDL